MNYQFISYNTEEGVAHIRLNRPEVLNAFHFEMGQEVLNALNDIRNNKAIRAVLVSGEGRAFCAGQDLAAVTDSEGNMDVDIGKAVRECYNPIVQGIREIEKPFVCAVNGVAAGAGANLALANDIVLAGESASFVQAFCKIGLIPDSGGTFILPRLVGSARAAALMMTGDKVKATEAQQMGMIYRVCSDDTLLEDATLLARNLATQPTKGIGLTKQALNKSMSNDLIDQLSLEADLQIEAGKTNDFTEGVRAFLEKRAPKFTGN